MREYEGYKTRIFLKKNVLAKRFFVMKQTSPESFSEIVNTAKPRRVKAP